MGNPVCLWQTELFKLNLKSSPSSSGYNRRRRLATRSSGKQQAERTAVRTAPIVCPEESPLVRPQAHTHFPDWGLTRRLRRELGLAVPWGTLLFRVANRRGCRGASGKPPACIDRRQLCRKKSPLGGLTRRLRRGLGLAVPRGAHTFLSVAKEKCAKESQRHGDSRGGPPRFASRASSCGSPFGAVLVLGSLRSPAGKKPFIAHFDGGARYVARSIVGQITPTIVRARSSPFSAVKMGGPFSLRCLSPLCSGAVGAWQAYSLRVGMFSCGLGIFAAQKASGISNPRWPF